MPDATPDAEDLRHLHRAVELSAEAVRTRRGRPYGAVIVRGGEVVAEAFNCVEATGDPTDHAELRAIRKAYSIPGASLKGATLYASGEPCPMCMAAILMSGIARCFYATTRDDADRLGFPTKRIYEELPLPPSERSVPAWRIAVTEADRVMDDWDANRPTRQV
jgi:tRNA(Arg) A34 adenosine deaminase TadA